MLTPGHPLSLSFSYRALRLIDGEYIGAMLGPRAGASALSYDSAELGDSKGDLRKCCLIESVVVCL